MGKLVSPEELHEFLMSLPKEKLEAESQKVKAHLAQLKVEKIKIVDFNELDTNLETFAIEQGAKYTTNSEKISEDTTFSIIQNDTTIEISFVDPVIYIYYKTRLKEGHFIVNLYDSFNPDNMNSELFDFIESKYYGLI